MEVLCWSQQQCWGSLLSISVMTMLYRKWTNSYVHTHVRMYINVTENTYRFVLFFNCHNYVTMYMVTMYICTCKYIFMYM